MALKECKECKKSVSSKAKKCPHCGNPTGGLTFLQLIGALFVIFLFFLFINILANSGGSTTKTQAGFEMPDLPLQKTYVTYDKFTSLKDGMSYSEVRNIIGIDGEETSRNFINMGSMGKVTTIMYSWVNDNGSNMNAMFQNDKLVNKAQFGLK